MKKLLAFVLPIILVFGTFAACASPLRDGQSADYDEAAGVEEPDISHEDIYDDDEDTPENEVWSGGPVRGTWADGIYTNEYLNLRFVAPPGWIVADDDEIAALLGFATDVFVMHGHDIPDNFWELAGINAIIDMMATDPFMGINVQVLYERLMFPLNRLSAAEYMDIALDNLEGMGLQAHIIPGTTQIGDYIWYSYLSEAEMFGEIVHGRTFINIQDGFARSIVISYNAVFDPVDELLARFTSLDVPAPTPEPESFDEALIGAWAWDDDNSYVYVFESNGQGRRGFYPDLEDFTWLVRGVDTLVISVGLLQESWIYAIDGDTVTMESRLVEGLVYTYVRWEGDFIVADDYEVDFTGHPIIGTWAWEDDSRWVYEFNTDGTGLRGWTGEVVAIYWYVYEDILLIDAGGGIEQWQFTIDDNILTLEMPGTVYRYVWQGSDSDTGTA